MSNLVVPNEAKLDWAAAQIEDSPTLTDCVLRLYSGDLTIDASTTQTELDALECDFPGYTPQPLTDWTDPVIIDGKARTEPEAALFEGTADTPGEINGCYATNAIGTKFWFASKFTSPVPIPFEAELQVPIELDLASIFSTS